MQPLHFNTVYIILFTLLHFTLDEEMYLSTFSYFDVNIVFFFSLYFSLDEEMFFFTSNYFHVYIAFFFSLYFSLDEEMFFYKLNYFYIKAHLIKTNYYSHDGMIDKGNTNTDLFYSNILTCITFAYSSLDTYLIFPTGIT